MSLHLDITAQIGEPLDEATDGLGLVVAVEVKGAEVAVLDAVAEHVEGGGEHGGRDGQDGLLGSTAGLDAEELGAKVAVLLASRGPGGGNEGGLEPVGALAHPGRSAFAGALVVARTEAGP